jgi:ribosomal protein L4
MYHQTIELLLEKGNFQRDPLFYPTKNPEFISSQDFADGIFGKGRRLAATEIISISFNLKKSIMAKTLSIAFSQVAQTKEVREFLTDSEKTANQQIQAFSKIMQADNLPAPKSWETEVTTSTDAPFSDKLMLYHTGFLFQAAQTYHGAGLASAMRTDLVTTYESIILKNLMVTKKWFNLMVQNKWLEQPPLAPNRDEIAKEK